MKTKPIYQQGSYSVYKLPGNCFKVVSVSGHFLCICSAKTDAMAICRVLATIEAIHS